MAKPTAISVKTVFEVRYQATLDFYQKLYATALEFADTYPHWQTDNIKIQLRDFDSRCSLTITHNRFVYSQDLQYSDQKEGDRIKKAIGTLPKALGKDVFTRVGLRRKYLIPVDMKYEDLVDLTTKKLLTGSQAFYEGIGPDIKDISVVLDLEAPGIQHLTVGPIIREQMGRHLNLEPESHFRQDDPRLISGQIFDEYPSPSLFVDCDYGDTEVKAENLEKLYNDACQDHATLLANIVKYMLGVT